MTETSAPERVWIQPDAFGWPWECWETPPDPIADSPCVEYIRADRAREILAGALQAEAERIRNNRDEPLGRYVRAMELERAAAFVRQGGRE